MCSNTQLIIPAILVLLAAMILSVSISAMLRNAKPRKRSFLECSRDWAKKWRGRK